ncbi:hypothetical protein JL721_10844 [Aureococcus anophagefferens]|nr:hypothetical protein JL721_10844 [Aureococcus anophagefferens]
MAASSAGEVDSAARRRDGVGAAGPHGGAFDLAEDDAVALAFGGVIHEAPQRQSHRTLVHKWVLPRAPPQARARRPQRRRRHRRRQAASPASIPSPGPQNARWLAPGLGSAGPAPARPARCAPPGRRRRVRGHTAAPPVAARPERCAQRFREQ